MRPEVPEGLHEHAGGKKQLLNTANNNVQRFDIGGIIGIDFVAEERSLVRG